MVLYVLLLNVPDGPGSQEVVAGGPVQLTCLARTDPQLEKSLVVDWYRHGVLITPGPGIIKTPENSLILLAAEMADSGGYQCKASTMLGMGGSQKTFLLQNNKDDIKFKFYNYQLPTSLVEYCHNLII